MRPLRKLAGTGLVASLILGIAGVGSAAGAAAPFLAGKTVSAKQPSSVPATGSEAGDINPYGVAVVPASVGRLHRAAVLVSNFNNSNNQQGTGSTITQISPTGHQSDLRSDRVDSETVIASGFPERNDPAALVVGPTGVGLGLRGAILYVASTEDNRITAVPAPFLLQSPLFGTGFTLTSAGSLNAPLGLAVAPNGDIITVNGGDGKAVETTPFSGQQIATTQLDNTPVEGLPNGNGTLFGIAVTPGGRGLYFVDDGSNTLNKFS